MKRHREELVSLLREILHEVAACRCKGEAGCRAAVHLDALENAVTVELQETDRILELLDDIVRRERVGQPRYGEPCRVLYLAGHALGLAAFLGR
ncbi:MAG: hypothetical protein H7841_06210 [Magnetospirillum sp. WYHS-4]